MATTPNNFILVYVHNSAAGKKNSFKVIIFSIGELIGVCTFLKGSSKSSGHERKSTMTPTQRESVPAKSPVSGTDPVASHSPFDPHHRPVVPGEVYRAHLSPHLDPTLAYHRVLDPGTVL